MKTAAFILCADPQPDWHVPRQLLPIDGEPLLQRTINQAYSAWDNVFVVTDKPDRFGKLSCGMIYCGPPVGCCQTCLETHDHWIAFDRVVFMLGDVCFTHDAIRRISSNFNSIVFWSDRAAQEIFALAILNLAYGIAKETMERVVRVGQWRPMMSGFRDLYMDLQAHHWHPTKLMLQDATQDFDKIQDYNAFLKGETKNQ